MNTSRKTSIIRWVFALVGITAMAASVYLGYQQYQLELVGVTTTGKVVRIIETYDSENGTMYKPEVRFTTEQGNAVTFASSVSSSYSSYRVGDVVPVIYNPSNPQDAHINTLFQRYFAFVITMIFAVVFGGIAFGQLFIEARRKKLLQYLISHGARVQAKVLDIRPVLNEGDQSAYYIIECEGLNPVTARQQQFSSQPLENKPGSLQPGDSVDVYVDRQNEHRYVVDCRVFNTSAPRY